MNLKLTAPSAKTVCRVSSLLFFRCCLPGVKWPVQTLLLDDRQAVVQTLIQLARWQVGFPSVSFELRIGYVADNGRIVVYHDHCLGLVEDKTTVPRFLEISAELLTGVFESRLVCLKHEVALIEVGARLLQEMVLGFFKQLEEFWWDAKLHGS